MTRSKSALLCLLLSACGTSPRVPALPIHMPDRSGPTIWPVYDECSDAMDIGVWSNGNTEDRQNCDQFCIPRVTYRVLCHNSTGEPPHFFTDQPLTSLWGRAPDVGCGGPAWRVGRMVLDERIYIDRGMIDVQSLSTWEVPTVSDCHPSNPPEKREIWFFREHPEVTPYHMTDAQLPQ